jgi:tetratricopeptide (TPR) repeat protein
MNIGHKLDDVMTKICNLIIRKMMMRRASLLLAMMMSVQMLLAQSALDQANGAYQRGDYAKALSDAEIAVQQHASAEALFCRANCNHKLGELSRALDDYDAAKSAGYSKDDLYLNRGICKTSLSLFESARIDLMTYLQRNEDDPKAYYWMATVEYMTMENRASLRYLDEAIYRDSTYSDAIYLRAANYADQNKMNLAMEDFQLALELNPTLHRSKMNMAVILIDMGQFRNAIEMLSELKLENIDFTAEVLYYRGEALYNIHDMEGACGDWVEAAEMGDSDAEVNYRKLCIDKNDKPRFKRRTYFQF